MEAQVFELIRLREANRGLALEREGGAALPPVSPRPEESPPRLASSTASPKGSGDPSLSLSGGVPTHPVASTSTTYMGSGGGQSNLPVLEFAGGRSSAWGDGGETPEVDVKGKGVMHRFAMPG